MQAGQENGQRLHARVHRKSEGSALLESKFTWSWKNPFCCSNPCRKHGLGTVPQTELSLPVPVEVADPVRFQRNGF